jgi:hypothetical protein
MSHKTASSKLDAKALDKIALSVSSGLLEGAFFPITRKKSVIGRKVNAHIPIQDSKVSREHASIEIKDSLLEIFYFILLYYHKSRAY